MFSILQFEEIDSTNAYLKREYSNLKDMTVVTSLHQTQGRGRLSRIWQDDKKSLMFSLLLKENLNPARLSLLPLLTGACVLKTMEEYNLPASIKWPNDILLLEKKCAGILLESVTKDVLQCLVIGVGINLNDEAFPSSIQDKAISLKQVTGQDYDKNDFLNRFLKHFEITYQAYLNGDDSYLDIIRSHFYLQDKTVLLNYYQENKHVKVKGIDDLGNLLVTDGDTLKSINSGEVTLENTYSK